jgi:hypothetical protein
MGIIYELSKYGGARVATVAGILSCGQKETKWWIPSDQYVVKYCVSHKEPNIPLELKSIRDAIICGSYNENNNAPTCTIQEAHKVITNATSPCRLPAVVVPAENARLAGVAASRKVRNVAVDVVAMGIVTQM